jgi:hypothetical protein
MSYLRAPEAPPKYVTCGGCQKLVELDDALFYREQHWCPNCTVCKCGEQATATCAECGAWACGEHTVMVDGCDMCERCAPDPDDHGDGPDDFRDNYFTRDW